MEKQDNTKVKKPIIIKPIKLDLKRLVKIIEKRRKLPLVYDKNKYDYYRNVQNNYNSNSFGYGLYGNPTNFDPNTETDKIEASFNSSRDKAMTFLQNISNAVTYSGINSALNYGNKVFHIMNKGIFKKPSKKGSLGDLLRYIDNTIGNGAEAVVVNNSPTTVGKMTSIPIKEMEARNSIPHTILSKYIGYVRDNKTKLPTYILQKVKVLTENKFPKYIKKLDKAMELSGFKRVNDPQVLYRAYTNGKVVIDDISPDNIGLTSGNPWLDKILPDFMKKPKIIDMAYLTVPEWLELGYLLKKKGGKLNVDSKLRS